MDIKIGDMVRLKPVKIISVGAPGIYRFSLPSDILESHNNVSGLCDTYDIEEVVERPLKPGDKVVNIEADKKPFPPINEVIAVHEDRVWLSDDNSNWLGFTKDYRRIRK